MSGKRKSVVFCSYKGKWKDELAERFQTDERFTLTAIGRNSMNSLHICKSEKT